MDNTESDCHVLQLRLMAAETANQQYMATIVMEASNASGDGGVWWYGASA
jgi:hypothetical protein